MRSPLAAVNFLSLRNRRKILHLGTEDIGAAALYFPLVGVVFGLVLVFLNRVLETYLASEILSVILVMALVFLTGGIHLEGLEQTFSGFYPDTTFDRGGNRRVGIFGLLAVLLVILLKIRSIEVTGDNRALGLLLTPIFSRWALVIFLYGSSSSVQEPWRIATEKVKGWHLLVTSALTLALAVAFMGRLGLWIGLGLSLFALFSRSYLHRRFGGLTWDSLGAVVELSEASTFLFFASI